MAMKRFEGKALQDAFQAAFGIPYTEATPAMVNFFIKLIKHGRRSCRSNAALYNYVQREFSDLKYKRVKVKSKFPDGKDWEALEITENKGRTTPVAVQLPVTNVSPDDEDDGGDE